MRPKKKRASREEIKQRLEKAAENGSAEMDLDFDEVTDVIDLALERTRRMAEETQSKASKTIEDIRSISIPPADSADG